MRAGPSLSLALSAFLVASPALATYSIVAIDPANGDIGVAVGSNAFAVGARVPFGEAGLGVIATQGNNNVGYHSRSLELLRSGLSAQQVLDRLLADDRFDGKAGRQVVILDAKGNIAIYTGPAAPRPNASKQGPTYAVIGNSIVGPHVVEAMALAFEKSTGELGERLYTALKAAELAGGDRAGQQAATILVFRRQFDNNDRYVSIRVDSHINPLHELRRLLDLQFARNYSATRNYFVRSGKIAEALQAAEKAVEYEGVVAGHHLHLGFLAYLSGNKERALQAFAKARQIDPGFKQSWDTALANAQFAPYRMVLEDQAFVSRVMN